MDKSKCFKRNSKTWPKFTYFLVGLANALSERIRVGERKYDREYKKKRLKNRYTITNNQHNERKTKS